ncbi:MAG: hypothetical protein U0T81_15460 [Saprospiraceae bacterium]
MKKFKILLTTGLFLIQWFFALSQSQYYDINWLLGYSTNIYKEVPFQGLSILQFQKYKNVNYTLVKNTNISLLYGFDYSCMSDYSGNFLMYTNGCKILNANCELMLNGDSINPGHLWESYDGEYYPLQNGTLFLPHPADTNLYYLLHKGTSIVKVGNGGYLLPDVIYYSLIDRRLDGGLGAVTQKNEVLIRDSLNESQMAACRHANGRDWWIPIRHAGQNLYYFLLLDSSGIRVHHTQRIGPNGPGTEEVYNGNACFNPQGDRYASCLRKDQLLLMDFDRCNGEFSNPVQLVAADSLETDVSCCFSPNGRFLYFNDILNLWQFDLQSNNIQNSQALIAVWDNFVYRDKFPTTFFQTRLAPDGKVYMSMYGGSNIFLHRINNPDFKGKDCNFIQRDVELINKHFGILPYFPNFKLGPVIGSSCDSLYKVSIEDDIRIGPNPVQDELTIYFLRDFTFTLALQFELYSTDGKLILNKPLINTFRNHPIDLRGVPEGVYVYRLSFEEGSIFKSGKVVVLH